MTTQEKITVMQAWLDGKIIQVKPNSESDKHFKDLDKSNGDLEWAWDINEYRIKPEPPKYVPYESAQEFLKAQKKHGPYVDLFAYSEESWKCYTMPYDVYNDEVRFSDEGGSYLAMAKFSYEKLCEECKWQDGTPCGKLK